MALRSGPDAEVIDALGLVATEGYLQVESSGSNLGLPDSCRGTSVAEAEVNEAQNERQPA